MIGAREEIVVALDWLVMKTMIATCVAMVGPAGRARTLRKRPGSPTAHLLTVGTVVFETPRGAFVT